MCFPAENVSKYDCWENLDRAKKADFPSRIIIIRLFYFQERIVETRVHADCIVKIADLISRSEENTLQILFWWVKPSRKGRRLYLSIRPFTGEAVVQWVALSSRTRPVHVLINNKFSSQTSRIRKQNESS